MWLCTSDTLTKMVKFTLVLILSIGFASANQMSRLLRGLAKRDHERQPCQEVVQGLVGLQALAEENEHMDFSGHIKNISAALGFDLQDPHQLAQRICPLQDLATLSDFKTTMDSTGLLFLATRVIYSVFAFGTSRMRQFVGSRLESSYKLDRKKTKLIQFELLSAIEAAGLTGLAVDTEYWLDLFSEGIGLVPDMASYEAEPVSTGPVIAKSYRLARAIEQGLNDYIDHQSFYNDGAEAMIRENIQTWTGLEINRDSDLHEPVNSVLMAAESEGLNGIYRYLYNHIFDHILSAGYPLAVRGLEDLESFLAIMLSPPDYYDNNVHDDNSQHPGDDPGNEERELIFGILRALRAMGLLDLVDDLRAD